MKKTIRTNHRLEVLVDLRVYQLVGEDRRDEVIRDTLYDIKRQIHRHVDDVNQVVLKWDTRHECSHCGCVWGELTADTLEELRQDAHSVIGEPICCEKAIAEFRAERGIPQSDCST